MSEDNKPTSRDLFAVIKKLIAEEMTESLPRWVENAFDDLGLENLTIVEKNSSPYAHISMKGNGEPFVWISTGSTADSLGGELGEIASGMDLNELGESATEMEMPFREFFEMLVDCTRQYKGCVSIYDECISIMTAARDREMARS